MSHTQAAAAEKEKVCRLRSENFCLLFAQVFFLTHKKGRKKSDSFIEFFNSTFAIAAAIFRFRSLLPKATIIIGPNLSGQLTKWSGLLHKVRVAVGWLFASARQPWQQIKSQRSLLLCAQITHTHIQSIHTIKVASELEKEASQAPSLPLEQILIPFTPLFRFLSLSFALSPSKHTKRMVEKVACLCACLCA